MADDGVGLCELAYCGFNGEAFAYDYGKVLMPGVSVMSCVVVMVVGVVPLRLVWVTVSVAAVVV